jgi:hypothetical protein
LYYGDFDSHYDDVVQLNQVNGSGPTGLVIPKPPDQNDNSLASGISKHHHEQNMVRNHHIEQNMVRNHHNEQNMVCNHHKRNCKFFSKLIKNQGLSASNPALSQAKGPLPVQSQPRPPIRRKKEVSLFIKPKPRR